MKLDADPARVREFEVLVILLLLVLAVASLSDFLLASTWTSVVEASQIAGRSEQHGALIEPWIPQIAEDDPVQTQSQSQSPSDSTAE